MVILLIIIIVAVLVIRPKDLLTKVFRVEEVEYLHRRNAKEAKESFDLKRWNRRFTWRVSLYSSILSLMTWTLLASYIPMAASAPAAASCGAVFWGTSLRLFARYRTVTAPLYLTLSRVSGSRWDIMDSPMKWVRVWDDEIRIRLPRDQHTTPIMLRQIQDLVTSRLEGQWTFSPDLPRFSLTFRRSQPIPVSVTSSTEPPATKSAVGMKKAATVTPASGTGTSSGQLEIEELDDNGPW